jgi:hypothetical protein
VKDHVTSLSELAKEYTDMLPLYQTVVDMQNGAAFKTLECRKGIQAGTTDVCGPPCGLPSYLVVRLFINANIPQPNVGPAVEHRYETVCNISLAEINHFHAMRRPDIKIALQQLLDGQIDMHEAMVEKLRKARAAVDEM